MGLFNVVGRASMAAGVPEDVTQVVANFDALAAILNGGIDNSNINAGAAILASKLANYPNDPVSVLKGDGSWAKGLTKISTYVASGANSFQALAIPQNFFTLIAIGWSLQSTGGASTVVARFNNDSAANYNSQLLQGQTTVATSTNNAATSSAWIAQGGTSYSPWMAIIPAYTNNGAAKSLMGLGFGITSSIISIGGGSWSGILPITQLDIFPAGSGIFAAGSIVGLYGLG